MKVKNYVVYGDSEVQKCRCRICKKYMVIHKCMVMHILKKQKVRGMIDIAGKFSGDLSM